MSTIDKLRIESKKRVTTDILDKMENDLDNYQLLQLNSVLNDEFNKVNFRPKEKHVDLMDIEAENKRLLKAFLDAKTVEGLSPRTLKKYEADIHHLFEWSIVSVTNMQTEDIREFLGVWKNRNGCQNITLEGMRKTYSSFFRFLADNGFILKNPMTRIKKMKTRKLYKKAYSSQELELLRYAIDPDDLRLKAIFELLLSSGIRIGELESIKISNINWDELTFKVLGKGNKERKCYFNDKAKIAMQKYLLSRKDRSRYNKLKYAETNDYFLVSSHKPYKPLSKNRIGRIIRNLGQRAGVSDVHAHRFRRTCATIYLNRGMPIEQVQRLLGHESIMTTQLYINVNEDAVRLNHNKFTN